MLCFILITTTLYYRVYSELIMTCHSQYVTENNNRTRLQLVSHNNTHARIGGNGGGDGDVDDYCKH